MFRVDDIYDEAKKLSGFCDDTKLFRWVGDCVSMVANKGDFEGWKGWLDICTVGCNCAHTSTPCNQRELCGRRCVTLPREIETVLAVNIGGHPSLGFGTLFNFHLNGPGDGCASCNWSWQDQGDWHTTHRDIVTPTRVVAFLQTAEDNGKELTIEGYDSAGNVLRRQENGEWVNGYRVPTIYGVAMPDTTAPLIARITKVFKERTAGSIRLASRDNTVQLANYEPDETLPQYRRIKLNRASNWVRIAYMKANPTFHSRYDHIPLRSRLGFLLAMQARKHYSDLQIGDAHAYEADAVRMEVEAQMKAEPITTLNPLQIVDRMSSLRDQDDFGIV